MAPAKIIIVTAPSGSGKTTLVKQLLQRCPRLSFSVSACTRKPRPGEENGRDYYFLAPTHFQALIQQEAFVEWEMVYPGKYYGTLRSELDRIAERGGFPLVDIDVKGALSILQAYPGQALSIFIKAPSEDALRDRLIKRGTETPASLEERLAKASFEAEFAPQFHHTIINDCLETACNELLQRVEAFLNAPVEVPLVAESSFSV
ncbi:MAG: guanylate kinase [Sphingobacteriales bacterium]|nr:MAG: guanylate kinase [Sphingobacteriales bacterium]